MTGVHERAQPHPNRVPSVSLGPPDNGDGAGGHIHPRILTSRFRRVNRSLWWRLSCRSGDICLHSPQQHQGVLHGPREILIIYRDACDSATGNFEFAGLMAPPRIA
jgi:hypothetical protein